MQPDNVKSFISDKKFIVISVCALAILLICRVVSMYLIPLNDSTEARYGEIARIMLETRNWVTLMQEYGVPFWAKPPLSSWLSAGSMFVFGVNELAVRLPSLLLSIAILAMVWGVAMRRSGQIVALVSVLVLASTIFFFLDAGTVMTDPSLLFCTTLIIISFWRAVVWESKLYGYLFFIGVGLGMLAKGPIAIVLTGMPIFIWVLRYNKWWLMWKNLPWIKGSFLTLLISVPWYLIAENRTPGFINYFFVGEHFNRFTKAGWSGDKYGFAHYAPYGTIWLYAFIGIFPWSIPAISWLVRHVKQLPKLCVDDDHWVSYLIISICTPLIFFTFSSNIIYPYVFPSLPMFALLFAELAGRSNVIDKSQKLILSFSILTGLMFILTSLLFVFKPEIVEKSQKKVVQIFKSYNLPESSQLVYWADKPEYSARFYSYGRAVATLNTDELCSILANDSESILVVESRRISQLPPSLVSRLNLMDRVYIANKEYMIYNASKVIC
ncbi:MAG: glycosyltransferase family 39 protein [Legionellaceae bacterium]|nr:glycosyltransferase family 39 protein [Legionellaceae bacterium]